MTQMTVDEFINSRMIGLSGPVEIVDATGRSLGQFTPSVKRMPKNTNPFTPDQIEEMRREAAGSDGSSLEEIWKRLGAK